MPFAHQAAELSCCSIPLVLDADQLAQGRFKEIVGYENAAPHAYPRHMRYMRISYGS